MGYKLFQPSFPRSAGRQHGETEFAATVQSLPASAFELDLPDTLPPGPASEPPNELANDGDTDSRPATDTESGHPTLSHIGRYALKQQLGQGGLGTVFEAWDPLLSRTVAVKTLQFNFDTPSRASLDGLFLNEARLAAGLSHPNIVTIFDAGLSTNGVYIAMERLHGRDLRQALLGGWRPTPTVAVLLARRVADGLAYAHARGIVHCDIKPANIHLGRKDKPKILDFGIARAMHGSALPALDGMVAGSPHYLAPEQLLGAAVSTRCDIYSLGVVLYELLTGRKAFDGASLEAITAAVLGGAARPAHEVVSGLPAPLSALVARAMAREPAERPASAAELSLELRRWLEAETAATPIAAAKDPAASAPVTPVTQPKPAARWWLWASAGGVLLAAVALWATTRQPGAPAPTAAVVPTQPLVVAPMTPFVATIPADAAHLSEPAKSVTDTSPSALTATTPVTSLPKPRPRPAATAVRAVSTAPQAAVINGSVQLAISPWGHVEVNGSPAGTTPPLTRLTLPEGTHTITVRNEDFAPHSVTVEVLADKPVTVRHRFGS